MLLCEPVVLSSIIYFIYHFKISLWLSVKRSVHCWFTSCDFRRHHWCISAFDIV